MVKEIIKQMILDFQKQDIEKFVRRDSDFYRIEKKANIFIGVRRCGKSTLMTQIMSDLIKNGVKRENILFMNFFDDRVAELKRTGPALVTDVYFSLFPEKKGVEKIYCFFDEIQEAENWEMFVERILRTELCEIYITGSSAKMLSKEIATQMRGRSLSYELFPFSFKEFLSFKKIPADKTTTKEKMILAKAFEEYFEKGGFPETLDLARNERIRIHQEYFRSIIFHDIVERFNVSNPQAVINLANRLLTSVSSLYSINRLHEYLKSIGFKTAKDFVSTALGWFEDCYFLFSVQIFDRSFTKRNVNLKKIYCVDHGMADSIDPNVSEKKGYLLENLVFLTIRRSSSAIYYYKTTSGKEVDFCWIDRTGKKNLVQVSFDMNDEKTKKREVSALFEAMGEINEKNATLVTMNESGVLELEDRTIRIVPAWEYLIKFEYSEKSVFQINDFMLGGD